MIVFLFGFYFNAHNILYLSHRNSMKSCDIVFGSRRYSDIELSVEKPCRDVAREINNAAKKDTK